VAWLVTSEAELSDLLKRIPRWLLPKYQLYPE
jgi:hypothetical protein